MTGHHPEDPNEESRSGLPPVHDLLKRELVEFCTTAGQPKYRASQIWQWLYVQRVTGWSDMRNIPKSLRRELDGAFAIDPVRIQEATGDEGDVRKILVGLRDGERVEQVLIPARRRNTVCVSSQVGCRFRCAFCASGQAGFSRNLAAGEIVAQVLAAARDLGDKPTHVVFMGIGEPFDNYDRVLKAVRIINDGDGLNIGARRITISTCGIVPGIERLAGEGLQVELSVSLHAPTNELRSRLMPVNGKYPLGDLIPACRDYAARTNRIVTFEYTLIGGINDSVAQARKLAELLAPLPCRVNLIPLSPVEEFEGDPPAPGAAQDFVGTLGEAGINATLRKSRGTPLSAACGQLRASKEVREDPDG